MGVSGAIEELGVTHRHCSKSRMAEVPPYVAFTTASSPQAIDGKQLDSVRFDVTAIAETWSPADKPVASSTTARGEILSGVEGPYISTVADFHRGDHVYVTPISTACWMRTIRA
jgi:hypothetical protein